MSDHRPYWVVDPTDHGYGSCTCGDRDCPTAVVAHRMLLAGETRERLEELVEEIHEGKSFGTAKISELEHDGAMFINEAVYDSPTFALTHEQVDKLMNQVSGVPSPDVTSWAKSRWQASRERVEQLSARERLFDPSRLGGTWAARADLARQLAATMPAADPKRGNPGYWQKQDDLLIATGGPGNVVVVVHRGKGTVMPVIDGDMDAGAARWLGNRLIEAAGFIQLEKEDTP